MGDKPINLDVPESDAIVKTPTAADGSGEVDQEPLFTALFTTGLSLNNISKIDPYGGKLRDLTYPHVKKIAATPENLEAMRKALESLPPELLRDMQARFAKQVRQTGLGHFDNLKREFSIKPWGREILKEKPYIPNLPLLKSSQPMLGEQEIGHLSSVGVGSQLDAPQEPIPAPTED